MQRRKDDLTFEGAWRNQVKEEAIEIAPAEKKEVKGSKNVRSAVPCLLYTSPSPRD